MLSEVLDRWRGRFAARLPDVPAQAWREVLAATPILKGFDDRQSERLREAALRFLATRNFESDGRLVPAPDLRLRIAALAALPVLELGDDWYDDWRTVVVFPGEFVRARDEVDAAGVIHEWEELLSGESWDLGPVFLSALDVAASGLGSGYNVVIHEMAHKLDMRNGDADGFPPLHPAMSRAAWTERMSDGFQRLNARLATDEDSAIDPYAAESPGEFFAVLSEYFFETPHRVKTEYPLVYDALAEFYRQDPARRLPVGPLELIESGPLGRALPHPFS